jgi:hypothetical protein
MPVSIYAYAMSKGEWSGNILGIPIYLIPGLNSKYP